MIAVRGLTRRFGSRLAVDDVSLDVGRGEIVALLGPNGAGKTTTMRIMAGLIAATSGTVLVDGVRLNGDTAARLRHQIGFLTESPGLWDRLTVRENLRVYAGLYALPRPETAIDETLSLFDLDDRGNTRAAELSKGMRQKVALARALLHQPPVLLLDEPTSGLDPEIRRNVRVLLQERRRAGCAVLVSTHNLDEAERIADRVAVLQTRLLAVDPPGDLRRRLTTGRLLVRVAGDPSAYLDLAQHVDPDAVVEGATLVIAAADVAAAAPGLVRRLVERGADVVEVRHEMPDLEDVYLHLVGAHETERR